MSTTRTRADAEIQQSNADTSAVASLQNSLYVWYYYFAKFMQRYVCEFCILNVSLVLAMPHRPWRSYDCALINLPQQVDIKRTYLPLHAPSQHFHHVQECSSKMLLTCV